MDDLILKLGGENQVNGGRIGTHSTGLALENGSLADLNTWIPSLTPFAGKLTTRRATDKVTTLESCRKVNNTRRVADKLTIPEDCRQTGNIRVLVSN